MKEIIITTSEDHVSYEVARALHRVGVVGIDNGSDPWNIHAYNHDDQKLIFSHRANAVIGYVIAPPIAVVVKWLEEQYGVYIDKLSEAIDDQWCIINAHHKKHVLDYIHVTRSYRTSQEAYEAAILYALEHIVSPLTHKYEQRPGT